MFAVITEPVTTEQMVVVVVVAAVVATVEVPAHHCVVVEVEGWRRNGNRKVDMAVSGLKRCTRHKRWHGGGGCTAGGGAGRQHT